MGDGPGCAPRPGCGTEHTRSPYPGEVARPRQLKAASVRVAVLDLRSLERSQVSAMPHPPTRSAALLFAVPLVVALAQAPISTASAQTAASPASAAIPTPQQLLDPAVAYQAERLVTVGAKSYSGRVAHVPGRTREEMTIDGRAQLVILDRPVGKAFVALQGSPMLLEVPLARAEEFLAVSPADIQGVTRIGAEAVDGRPATKYRIVHKEGEGHAWVDAQGLLLKAEGVTRRGEAFLMRLVNLRLQAPDPSAFQPPSDRMRVKLDIGTASGGELRRMLEMFGKKPGG